MSPHRTPLQPVAPHHAAAFAALLEAEADLDALDRMLLAWCVHAEGCGADAAWLLRSDDGREPAGPAAWMAKAAPRSGLADALARARRAPASGEVPEPPVGRDAWIEAWQRHDVREVGEGVMAVPLARGARTDALLLVRWSEAGDAIARRDAAIALQRAGVAARNAQARAHEARRRARLAAGVAELAAGFATSGNLAEARHLLLRLAVQGALARGGVLWTVDEEGRLERVLANGPAPLRDRFAQAFEAAAADVARQGRAASGDRAQIPGGVVADVAGETSAWMLTPVTAYGRTRAVLLIWDGLDRPHDEPCFDRLALDHVTTLANQAGLLFEFARTRDEIAEGERQRDELRRRLHAQDQMATLGELATRVAAEARNPIASIGAFARRAHRALPEGDPQRDYLEIVIREAERLEAMVQEQIQYAALDRPRLQMQDLNAVLQDVLRASGEGLVRRRVRLVKKLAPDLPRLLLDASRMRRVLENVMTFALESVLVGGRIRVESRRAGGYVVVEVAHDGPRTAGDLLEHLFVPFSSGSVAGAAVGLGVAQQIVREHGGEIRVRSEGEWNAIFSCTLPVRENEDRRRAAERRSGRNDRRRRPAA